MNVSRTTSMRQRGTSVPSGYFLCGCQAHWPEVEEAPEHLNLEKLPNGMKQDLAMNTFFDEAGFRICETHGQRLYGWRSPTHETIMYQPGVPEQERERRQVPDHVERARRNFGLT